MRKIVLLTILTTQLTGAIIAGVYARGVTPTPQAASERTVSVEDHDRPQDDPSSSEELFSNDFIRVFSIYPNPVTSVYSYASVKYEFHGEVREAKIVLCNMLGNVVGEYRLTRDSKQLNIATRGFTPGVYFYTLVLDSHKVATRKFIVRESS